MTPDPLKPKDPPPATETVKVTVTTPVAANQVGGDQVGATAVRVTKVEATPTASTASTLSYKIQNLTAWRIGIKALPPHDTLFILPPFGERVVSEMDYGVYDFAQWRTENLIADDVVLPPTTEARDTAVGCGVLLGLAYVIVGAVFYFVKVNANTQSIFWGVGAALAAIVGLIALGRWQPVRDRLEAFTNWLAHLLRLLVIIVIVIGLPGLVVLFFGDNLGPLSIAQLPVPRAQPAVLGLILQWSLIVAASILPIIVYFLFDRQKLGALREKFYRQILRLDPQMETLEDARQTYRPQVEEIYGPESGSGIQTFFMGTNIPILAATLVITIGWIIALPPIVASTSAFTLDDLYIGLVPHLSAINFGFMGAYVFTLNMLLRRYVRSDLSPKVYTHIIIRIFVVAVTVWALSALLTFGGEALGLTGKVIGAIYDGGYQLVHPTPAVPDSKTATEPTASAIPATDVSGPLLLLLAFFVGFVPETGMTIIQKYLRSQPFLKNAIPVEQDSHPLDRLDGINVYYQSRLLEEGIENIQNLAHSDLIELMMHTRIPMSILIDWVDQAILYQHLAELQPEDEAQQAEGPLTQLRKYGIRTATDLLKAYQAAQDRDAAKAAQHATAPTPTPATTATEKPAPDAAKPPAKTEAQKFLTILDEKEDAPIHRLQVLLDALADDEWLDNINYWHKSGDVTDQMYTFEAIMELRAAKRNQTVVTVSVSTPVMAPRDLMAAMTSPATSIATVSESQGVTHV